MPSNFQCYILIWYLLSPNPSTCVVTRTRKTITGTTQATKEETPGHGGLADARKPGVPSLDFFHAQLKLFKIGALGLSKLDSCCLERDDWVWRVSTNMKHLGCIIHSFPLSKKYSSCPGYTHLFNG